MKDQLRMLTDRVTQGDCLDVMKMIPDSCIDMILCDLPYGMTPNEWDLIIDFPRLWTEYERIIKPNGVIALTAAGAFTGKLIMSNLPLFKYKIVWIKSKSSNFLSAKKQPMRKHEDICIFYKRQPIYQPQMLMGDPYVRGWRKGLPTGSFGDYQTSFVKSDGGRYPNDFVFYEEDHDDWFHCKTADHEGGPTFHPTQKPVELGRYLIRTYTTPGALILDNACGSGSFLIAAMRERRHFIGIEKNEGTYFKKKIPIDFIAVCNERIRQEHLMKKA
ncbi:DNA-methyltransferase [Mucilaginibacter lutimaris]|uniref:site-specific DNA-methyltransferase (adenine-specific) n=1 Tax=Mucilaginibacter lutimaris TaxID=931629 RepID=A0ABW2ZE81_9SPHI